MHFLSERTHQTKIECSLSEIGDLLSGVVRFSGIGPLLFLTYINYASRSKPARAGRLILHIRFIRELQKYSKSNKTRLKSVTGQHSYMYHSQILSANFTLKQHVILSLVSHGLTFAKSYAFLYSSERTKTSVTDETTTFLKPHMLCKKQSFL